MQKKLLLLFSLFTIAPIVSSQTFVPRYTLPNQHKSISIQHPGHKASSLSTAQIIQQLTPAPLGHRCLAAIIEIIIFLGVSTALYHIIPDCKSSSIDPFTGQELPTPRGYCVIYGTGVVLDVLYVMLGGFHKRLMGIKVVDKNGNDPTLVQALVRALVKYIACLPIRIVELVIIPINIGCTLFMQDNKSLACIISDTRVIWIDQSETN